MVVIIGLITFVLGCVITYYFDHSGMKEPEKSNLELKEDAIRARTELADQQQNLSRLLELAIRNAVDETVKSIATSTGASGEAPKATPDRRSLYNRSYDEVKRSWSRLSETGSGEAGSTAPRKMDEVIPLPEKLDFEYSATKSQPPPAAAAATTASAPVIDLDEEDTISEPEELSDLEEMESLISDEPTSSDSDQSDR